MVTLVILAAAVAIVIGAVALVVGHGRRFDEVERFHVASRMTSEWARNGVTRPVGPGVETPADRQSADSAAE